MPGKFVPQFDYSSATPREGSVPLTWGENGELHERIMQMLREKTAMFRERGYDIFVGTEQEYMLPPRPSGPKLAHFEEQKATALRQLDDQGQHKKRDELAGFEPRDMVAYELHEELAAGQMAKTPIIQHRFGGGANGKPYYDPHKVMEINTLPTSPEDAVYNYHVALRTLQSLAAEYGLGEEYWKRDISISVVDRRTGQNIADWSAGKEDPRALRFAEGMRLVVEDALPVFVKHGAVDKIAGQPLSIGPSRSDTIRADGGRFELRLNHNPLAGDHMALTMLLTLAGMEYGLYHNMTDHYRQNVDTAEFVTKKQFDGPEQFFFMREVLNGASVGENGRLNPRMKDVFVYNSQGYFAKEFGCKTEELDMGGWANKIRVNPDNSIDWPPATVLFRTDDAASRQGALDAVTSQFTYGREIRAVVSYGTGQDIEYGKYSADDFRYDIKTTALNIMAQSKPLLETIGPVMLGDICTAIAKSHAYKTQPEHMPEVAGAFRSNIQME